MFDAVIKFAMSSFRRFIVFLILFNTVKAQFSLEEIRLRDEVLLTRSRRQLLFPNVTLLQFNMGVTVPTPEKTIVCNWAFQANFVLPWNRTQIPLDILYANSGYDGLSKRDTEGVADSNEKGRGLKRRKKELHEMNYENDAKLYHFYKYAEEVLDGFGYNGTACILQTLCQLGAEPLHCDDKEDLLHELASFILNPNNDLDDDQLAEHQESRLHIQAYNYGRYHQNCSIYQHCTISLIDMFTKIHEKDFQD